MGNWRVRRHVSSLARGSVVVARSRTVPPLIAYPSAAILGERDARSNLVVDEEAPTATSAPLLRYLRARTADAETVVSSSCPNSSSQGSTAYCTTSAPST